MRNLIIIISFNNGRLFIFVLLTFELLLDVRCFTAYKIIIKNITINGYEMHKQEKKQRETMKIIFEYIYHINIYMYKYKY